MVDQWRLNGGPQCPPLAQRWASVVSASRVQVLPSRVTPCVNATSTKINNAVEV